MKRPHILITGSNGQVGFELERIASVYGDVLAPRRQELDLGDASAVRTYLDKHRPSVILNAAAYTGVDNAENERKLAQRINADMPAQLAEYSSAAEATLVHYSSDYVYPGHGNSPWREDSATGPLNTYGRSKLDGDLAVSQSGCRHLIFRTSWVYSARGNNFMKTMLRLGQSKSELRVVGDQIGSPTPARLIAQISDLALKNSLESGIYHLAPRGETSWHGFAREIFVLARRQGASLKISTEALSSISTAEYPTPAERPLNSRLSLIKLEAALGIQLPHWRDQLALTVDEHFKA